MNSRSRIITDLSIAFDSKILNDSEGKQQRDDPGAVVDLFSALPVMDDLMEVSFVQTQPEPFLHCKPRKFQMGGQ